MKRAAFFFAAAAIGLVCWVVNDLAMATGSLDGQTFLGEVGKKGQAKGDKDTFIFREGKFRSTACDPYGFKEVAYQTASAGNSTTFQATAVSPTDGQMFWKGTVKGNAVEGTTTWLKPGKQPVENWFKGKLKK